MGKIRYRLRRDRRLIEALNAFGVQPKTVTEVGMGTNTKSLETLVRGLPELEKYTVIERGDVPEEYIRRPRRPSGLRGVKSD